MANDERWNPAFWDMVLGWGSVVAAFLLGVWRWGKSVAKHVRSTLLGLSVARRLADRWGPEAPTKLEGFVVAFEAFRAESQLRFAICERANGLGVFEANANAHWTWCNHQCAELLGRDTSDLLGGHWLNAVAESDRDRLLSLWSFSFQRSQPLKTEITMVDGKKMQLELWIVEAGGVTRCTGQISRVKRQS